MILRDRLGFGHGKRGTLDVLVSVGAFPLDEIAPGKALLFPVVQLMPKMTEYPEVAREKMAEYGSQDALGDGQQEQDEEQEQEQEQESRLRYVCEKVRKVRMSHKSEGE